MANFFMRKHSDKKINIAFIAAIFLLLGLISNPTYANEYATNREITMPNKQKIDPMIGSQKVDGKFTNRVAREGYSFEKLRKLTSAFISDKSDQSVPSKTLPLSNISAEQLLNATNNTMWRLGHSTLLMKLDDELWMTDPVFSKRASPSQIIGPKRFHPTPIKIGALPEIKGVIISHDHYDHLDKAAILELSNKVETFYTPLNVGDLLIDWGVAASKVQQYDWWDSVKVGEVTITCTPAQHFSGRGLLDGDKRLWASWAIKTSELNVFFSGDTGYFEGFKTIGEKLGPFDIAFVETGAYNTLWADIHMLPEDTLQAHLDLQSVHLYPIHNGTFDLSLHAWYEPFDRINELANKNNVSLLMPIIGEPINMLAPPKTSAWWQDYK